jgi:hypothetical protein
VKFLTKKLKKSENLRFNVSKLTNTQLEAEDILNEAYHHADSIYQQVQGQLNIFKEVIKESKRIINKEKNIFRIWRKKQPF